MSRENENWSEKAEKFIKLRDQHKPNEPINCDELDAFIKKALGFNTEEMKCRLADFIGRLGWASCLSFLFELLGDSSLVVSQAAKVAFFNILACEVPYEEVMDLKELILDLVDPEDDAAKILPRREWCDDLASLERAYRSGKRKISDTTDLRGTEGPGGGVLVSDWPITTDDLRRLKEIPFVGLCLYSDHGGGKK